MPELIPALTTAKPETELQKKLAGADDIPLAKQESFWLSLAAGASAVLAFVEAALQLPFLPGDWTPYLLGAATILGAIAGRRARTPGAETRAEVRDMQPQLQKALDEIEKLKKATGQQP